MRYYTLLLETGEIIWVPGYFDIMGRATQDTEVRVGVVSGHYVYLARRCKAQNQEPEPEHRQEREL